MIQVEAQVPPYSLETEQAIIGGIILKPELFTELVGVLKAEHFYRTAHQLIYTAMSDCYAVQIPIGIVSLRETLNDNGSLEDAGGFAYLTDLALFAQPGYYPTPESMRHWVKVIRNNAGRREWIEVGHDLVALAEDKSQTNILEQIQKRFLTAAETMEIERKPSISSLVDAALTDIEARLVSSTGSIGLSTGFHSLDQKINGLQANKLIILAARSGVGKTSFSLNVAVNVILKEKRPVLFFSLEMTSQELMERVLKLVAESTSDRQKLANAAATIKEHEHLFLIEDRPDLSVSQIKAITQKTVTKYPDLGLVIVDYIGKVRPEDGQRFQSKTYEVEATTWGLKTIAKTLSLPVMALCQMNRGIEGRQDKAKPFLSDLKDSGAIEQDADLVLFITAEEGMESTPTLTIGKQRNGPKCEIPLFFAGHITKFTERNRV
jgi:replicative DNA helicase